MIVIGRIGKDATVNEVNGRKVINFSVAHSERFKDAHGVSQQRTIWVECSRWTDQTGVAPYLKSGTMVSVSGKPEVSTYKNRDGLVVATQRCRVDFIELLSSQRESDPAPLATYNSGTAFAAQPTPSVPPGANHHPDAPGNNQDDDLPF